jgi:hypothetical protein
MTVSTTTTTHRPAIGGSDSKTMVHPDHAMHHGRGRSRVKDRPAVMCRLRAHTLRRVWSAVIESGTWPSLASRHGVLPDFSSQGEAPHAGVGLRMIPASGKRSVECGRNPGQRHVGAVQKWILRQGCSMGLRHCDAGEACSTSTSIYWKRTAEVFPEALWSETDLVAVDSSRQGSDEKHRCIGGILQEQHGPDEGAWVWTMTARMPGARFPFTTQGRERSREGAQHRLLQCYEQMLRFYAPK